MISIILPVYNTEPYLRECLDSILCQTYVDWECICVDDGSRDGSGAILYEYATRDVRFHIFHQENAGAWSARNAALDVVRGEWVTFVDADDVLNPNWLQAYASLIKKTNADLVRQCFVYGKSCPDGFFERSEQDVYESYCGAKARAWVWNTLGKNGFLCFVCVRRDVIRESRFPRVSVKEDSLWLLGLAPRIEKVAQGEFDGYFYRATEGSLMKRRRNVSQCVSYLNAMRALWNAQRKMAEKDGFVGIVRRNIRDCVDNDVIEWVMMSASPDDMPKHDVGGAYRELESAGALDVHYSNRERYRFGFWWWRRTGQIWAIRIPGIVFVWLRRAVNALKRRCNRK